MLATCGAAAFTDTLLENAHVPVVRSISDVTTDAERSDPVLYASSVMFFHTPAVANPGPQSHAKLHGSLRRKLTHGKPFW